MARPVRYLVVHHNGVDGRTWRDILRTHLGQGWLGIGYHQVIHEDGTVHAGRDESRPGAHTSGFNVTRDGGMTLAVCVIGNLDKHPMNGGQWTALVKSLADWCAWHELDPFTAILGHRETRPFVRQALRTKKSCPGKFVDMGMLRRDVAHFMGLI